MKAYMMTVIASAVLCAVALIMSPGKWKKYIKVITGMMIMSVIIGPVSQLKGIELFAEYETAEPGDTNLQKKVIKQELEKRLEEDVAKRISEEFGITADVSVLVGINENYEITGVEEIAVWTKTKPEKLRQRLTEVYSPQRILFRE